MSRPNLYMLIGLPGAGKSTFVKKVTEGHRNFMVASTDALIEVAAKLNKKTYDEAFPDAIKSAEKTMYELVKVATDSDWSIVWDQTNLNRKTRAKKLIMIPDHYRKVAIFFKTPHDIDERLEKRAIAEGKSIPGKVFLSMAASLEYPALDEGFDRIMSPEEFIDEELRNLQVA
jgi:predicted kinase